MVEITVALIMTLGVILAAAVPSWVTSRRTKSPNGQNIGEMVYETNVAVADLTDAFQAHVSDSKAHDDTDSLSVGDSE